MDRNSYSRTPLIRPPSESHWCGRIIRMVSREGFIYFALLQWKSYILGIEEIYVCIVSIMLKQTFMQYPLIHTNYSLSNCTISNKKDFNRASDFLVIH